MKSRLEDFIVDPAAESAGFLVASGDYLKETYNSMFFIQI
ncbi:hypothetical protein ACIP97_13905 [Peribacillus frigoritolerans]